MINEISQLNDIYMQNILDLAIREQVLSEDFIRRYQDKLNWRVISECQTLSEDFIREFKDKVRWDSISWRQILSEDFIKEFIDKLDPYLVCRDQKLSEDFLWQYVDWVNWQSIHNQELSNDFIKTFFDKIDKNDHANLVYKQELSMEVIEKLDKRKVSWKDISRNQNLTEEFIEKYINKLDIHCLALNEKLDPEIRDRFIVMSQLTG